LDKAFEVLVEEHYRTVFCFFLSALNDKHMAEDLTQEVFLIAHRKMDSFETGRSFGAWLRGIAKNLLLGHFRESSRARFSCMEGAWERLEGYFAEHDDTTHDTWGDRLQVLRECLGKLSDNLRRMIDLHYRDNLNARMIAERLDVRWDTVRHGLSRARSALRGCIDLETSGEGE
jgi:RNA polymerase sigma-70 factor (ECF subfamily)